MGSNPGKVIRPCRISFTSANIWAYTPQEFFDVGSTNPTKANELLRIAKTLPNDQLDHLIAIAKP